jgi:hypothetical protein
MNPEEYQAILVRLSQLEHRDRRLRIERGLMLCVIGWLIATGPASRVLFKAAPLIEARSRSAAPAAARGLAELGRWLRVSPVLDPKTVIEDQQEAFGEAAPEATKPGTKPAGSVALAGPTLTAKVNPSKPAVAARTAAAVPARSEQAVSSRDDARRVGSSASRRTGPAATSPMARAALAIGRDVARTLAPLPADQSFRSLAFADWPDPGSLASSDRTSPQAAAPSRFTVLPATPDPESSSTPPAPPAPSGTAAAPVTLKALGYAESADGSAQIVLSDGNALYVVNEGQDFLDRFRVVALRPEGVDVEDRLTKQTLHLSFGD